jgi:apolipoprotein N-acyltransferase
VLAAVVNIIVIIRPGPSGRCLNARLATCIVTLVSINHPGNLAWLRMKKRTKRLIYVASIMGFVGMFFFWMYTTKPDVLGTIAVFAVVFVATYLVGHATDQVK